MGKIKSFVYVFILVTATLVSCKKEITIKSEVQSAQTNPLPSWNDGPVKTAIMDFVAKVSTEGSPDYVAPEDRIATFDNDGTLWCEKPLVQELFVFYLVKKEAEKKPELKEKQPYKAILENDTAYLKTLHQEDLVKLVVSTHTGMSAEAFATEAATFFANAKTPSGMPVAKIVYQPQLELLEYLRNNGFKTYICSGGTTDFIRAISQQYYGIPPEQVIGTQFKSEYADTTGVNDVMRLPGLASFNDKQEKPVNIWQHIGKRPILACGNEGGGGDIYMLRFSQGGNKPSLQLIINHDDEAREAYYQEKDNKSLNWAAKYKWQVISIKNDWKTVYPSK
ncbi:HAD family hydrolase [Flavobacterium sp. RHBU_3]|uniref:HAD family hydrolase n=1 Tax=Flavobacterium sp. RHBU_3 TaxID=3391184 RepID=UPI003984C497